MLLKGAFYCLLSQDEVLYSTDLVCPYGRCIYGAVIGSDPLAKFSILGYWSQ